MTAKRKHRSASLSLREIGKLLKGAPPMAAYYQRLALVNDANSLRKAKSGESA